MADFTLNVTLAKPVQATAILPPANARVVTLARPSAVEAFPPPPFGIVSSKTTAVVVFTPPTTLQTVGAKPTAVQAFAPTSQTARTVTRPPLELDVRDGGVYTISGTVKRENTPSPTPLRRRVRLYNEFSKRLVREGWSDATTGAFSFSGLANTDKYTAIAIDHQRYYRAVIVDGQAVEEGA